MIRICAYRADGVLDEVMTIRQFADEYKIPVSTIYLRIKQNDIQPLRGMLYSLFDLIKITTPELQKRDTNCQPSMK